MSEPFLKVETKREDESSDESSSDEEKKKRFSSQQVQNKQAFILTISFHTKSSKSVHKQLFNNYYTNIRRNHELKGAQARELHHQNLSGWATYQLEETLAFDVFSAKAQHAPNALKNMLSIPMFSMHLMIKRMISMLRLRLKYKITNIRPKSQTHGGLECVKKLSNKYLMLGLFKETEL
jgi:hypothetical protein